MNTTRIYVAAAIIVLTILSFFQFPGHTFLYSDTQIYIPILERLWDSSTFNRELIAQRPHVSFTMYDEAALALRTVTGLEFRDVLQIQQVLFRALGLLGVYLLATALGLPSAFGLLTAGAFALGATIVGPSVLLLEYEPVPRGFAIPLLFLALGLAAHGRDLAAGIAASVAFLYHPPTVLPFWVVYFLLTLWPTKPEIMRRRIIGLAPILAGVIALLVLSRLQAGITEPQPFFSRIDPFIEKLQRLRASYNWVSMWPAAWKTHYAFLFAASMLAFWRIRKGASQDVRFFLVGLPLIGLLSMPVAHYLLEEMKWALMPQLQVTRALLFVTAFACILCSAAAFKAGQAGRYWEALLWFVLVYALPANSLVLQILPPDLTNPVLRRRALLVLGLASLATFAVWAETRKKQWRSAVLASVLIVPFFVIPGIGKVVNYPQLETADLDGLTKWARSSTSKDSRFLFPDAGKELYPGIFRAKALRAVYVDWKAGGQVNFLRAFSREWWDRWQATMATFPPADPAAFTKLGINYVVLRRAHDLPSTDIAYRNDTFAVYRVADPITRARQP